MSDQCNILISSAGRRVALLRTFKEALAHLGVSGTVLAADMSRLSSAFHIADDAFVVPRCTSAEFIPTLLRACRERTIRLVIPTIDTELPVLAAHRDEFRDAGIDVAISAPDVIAISRDKVRTHDWLKTAGHPTVQQWDAETLLQPDASPQFPLVAKPARGSSSIGVSRVESLEDLRFACRGGEYVVQSIAPGHEYTVDVFVDKSGACRCAVPRRRLEVRAGEVSKGQTERIQILQDLATRIAEDLPGAYGVLNVQIFYDADSGVLNAIEINARFGGGYPLTHKSGAHFAHWLVLQILGRDNEIPLDPEWNSDLTMLRYDDAVFVASSQVD